MMSGSSPIHWLLPLLAGLGLLAAFGIWVLAKLQPGVRSTTVRRRFSEAFGENPAHGQADSPAGWLENLGNQLISHRKLPDGNEVKLLIARAGFRRKTDLSKFVAIQALLPLLAGLLASQAFFVGGLDRSKTWAILFLACASAWLLPKRILAHMAASRQLRIAEQAPIFIHLLRVLLGTGLSLDQSLRSLAADSRELLPDIAAELDVLLRHIDAGDDVSQVLRHIAETVDVPAVTDLTLILDQAWRMGGSVTKSLTDLSNLIEDRMQTDLKEKVSKLSAKMTVVMMLFLFPALLVFLAAPGFMAVIRGLSNATGS